MDIDFPQCLLYNDFQNSIVRTFMTHAIKKDSNNMSIGEYISDETNVKDTPFGYTLSLIGGKWKMIIMYCLAEKTTMRYNELHRYIGSITYRILSLQLKELENDGIIIRKEYAEIPPKVEYSLSEKGFTLMPILDTMCYWGQKNKV
jgi:DNA-binding HxlR family transcriptional regulator